MFNNLFKSLFKTTPQATAPAAPEPTETQIEGEKQLADAQQKLNILQNNYAHNNFSGHPEEMLESIEDLQEHISALHRAQKRGWVPDAKVIAHIKEEMEKHGEHLTRQHVSQKTIAEEMAHRQRHLDEARQGLR